MTGLAASIPWWLPPLMLGMLSPALYVMWRERGRLCPGPLRIERREAGRG